MLSLFNVLNKHNAQVRELDPRTTQRIKEGAYLTKLISEIEVAARKCHFYAGISIDPEVINFFNNEGTQLKKLHKNLQSYYESMTME